MPKSAAVVAATNDPHDPWLFIPQGAPRDLARSAIEAFGAKGFHATTTRDIAARVGMSPAGLYVHYKSKGELLFLISKVGHEAVDKAVADAVRVERSPEKRIRAFVSTFTAWHAEHHLLARVLQYEMPALQPEHYSVVAAIRRHTERQATNEVKAFVSTMNIKTVTTAILSMGIDVARWYNPKSSPQPAALGKTYANLVAQMLAC